MAVVLHHVVYVFEEFVLNKIELLKQQNIKALRHYLFLIKI